MIKSFLSIFRDSTNSFEGQRDGETILLLLRKHIITLYLKLGLFVLAAIVPIVVGLTFIPYFSLHNLINVFLFISSLWYLGLWLGIFHVLSIYTLNTVLVTDRRVIESDQHGLFNRITSELNSNRIQDVSVHTNGILETIFKFGNITVQTASSEAHFVFHQIPEPDRVKDIIMQITASVHSGVKASAPL